LQELEDSVSDDRDEDLEVPEFSSVDIAEGILACPGDNLVRVVELERERDELRRKLDLIEGLDIPVEFSIDAHPLAHQPTRVAVRASVQHYPGGPLLMVCGCGQTPLAALEELLSKVGARKMDSEREQRETKSPPPAESSGAKAPPVDAEALVMACERFGATLADVVDAASAQGLEAHVQLVAKPAEMTAEEKLEAIRSLVANAGEGEGEGEDMDDLLSPILKIADILDAPTASPWSPIETAPIVDVIILRWPHMAVGSGSFLTEADRSTSRATHWAPIPPLPGKGGV
jgi:hypothetical protein